MQKKWKYGAFLMASMMVLSCKDDTTSNETAEEVQIETTTDEKTIDAQNITTSAKDVETAPAGERPKLNPPHGQPFHRCDIAVGAPLDGSDPDPAAAMRQQSVQNQPKEARSFFKTVQSEQATNQQQPSPMTQPSGQQQPSTQTANTGERPKLNPPHGQPFHRCDIAVGAPLPEA